MNFPSKKVMPRYFIITAVLTLVAVAVMVKAVHIIFFEREEWLEKKEQITNSKKTYNLEAKRGNILASDGRILATSLSEYRLFLDFRAWEGETNEKWKKKDQHLRDSLFLHNVDTLAFEMHKRFPDIDPKKWKEHMFEGFHKKSKYWPIYPQKVSSLKLSGLSRKNRQLTYLDLAELRKLPLFSRRSSLNAEEIKMRKNPYGQMAYRTIGKYIDNPRFGLEKSYDSILAGEDGIYSREKVLNAWTQRIVKDPIDGSDIVTTIDIDMQDICERVLREELINRGADSGVCIVMEVPTGDVKAITSLQRGPNGQFREASPNAVTTHYEPGSVFKPMSFLVAFDDGKVKITDEVDINKGIFTFGTTKLKDANYGSGGAVGPRDVKYIIQNSSNVGTARLIDQHYLSDPMAFINGLRRVGVAEDLKIPIDGYWPPYISTPHDKHRHWSRTDLPWMSIGYVTQIPPINTLAFYNGLANKGKMMRPRFVKAVMKDGKVVQEFAPVVLRDSMAKRSAVEDIITCLKAVVSGGSGKKVASKNFQIAGKTGTAQIWLRGRRTKDYSVSFVGFFPADNPKYSCIVNIQKAPPAYGWHSGEVFKRVAEYIMAREMEYHFTNKEDSLKQMVPIALLGDEKAVQQVAEQLYAQTPAPYLPFVEQPEDGMPDLYGYALRDAVYVLEQKGLNVVVQGSGHVVKQSIEPGTEILAGQTVELTLKQNY